MSVVKNGSNARSEEPSAPPWREQERLLLGEVMRLVGRSLAPDMVFREMLHLMSELLGLNRGRIVLIDAFDAETKQTKNTSAPISRIRFAYGLTKAEIARGTYFVGEGITGAALAIGQSIIVQDIDAEPRFLSRSVKRANLPQETVAFIVVPIQTNRRTVGVLAAHRIRQRNRSLNDDVAVMKILATLAGQLLQLQSLVEEKTKALQDKNELLARALESAAARYGIVGTSPALLQALEELERVAQATASVLLLGESGTGKELFARALHLSSLRRDAPFIKVNCAAIPETLFESELFGHEKGAFTGAMKSRIGLFEQADHGTIFLDEIGEMPLAMQTKLLRTLQEGTIVRLGGDREIKVDIRVVTATNRDLSFEVDRGTFRRDLYYRLNVIPIRLPSLLQRKQDIRPLSLHFLNRVNQANNRNVNLSPQALDELEAYAWPGNIRELANVIERMVLLTDHAVISKAEVERFIPAFTNSTEKIESIPAGLSTMPVVREYLPSHSHDALTLQQALAMHNGNQSRAAYSLGLTPRQFVYRLRKLGIMKN
ncbi:sigma-54-dependent Fis family transcriptional regulator [Herminiimonas contaminans]|uniref:Sigma 54-interacting transcriptional regulator n=1 Tax=Herminiimonas contaminans TaxID=1111140 RepID=A0ABS0EYS3_9BURK|nr:sigma 54-interacting transcriptional regulator [Herminiimonas contaminans]MBF8179267.1 sigma 54-interacting transcriptional regulator [Herminiimonas contaminans]